MSSMHANALKAAAVLWVVWGLVHMFAGAIVLLGDATAGFQAIADRVDPTTLQHDYAPAVGGILNQHGWNLGWFGAATVIGAGFIWMKSLTAIWVTAVIGGFADLGYLLFVDLPGYVNFFPGTVMTLVSGSAILLSMWVWWQHRGSP
ncbi:MAG: hypothetical protein AAGF81_04510 [Pseudomonadota bacterium]